MSDGDFKSQLQLKAFSMTFKTKPEHVISDGYNSDAELQIYMYESDDNYCNDLMSQSDDTK